MPFQKGNTLGGRRREKLFREALLMELLEAGEDHRELRKIARKLIEKAGTGDVTAIREVADRIDGKVPQGIVGGDEDDPPVNHEIQISRIIVTPDRRDDDPRVGDRVEGGTVTQILRRGTDGQPIEGAALEDQAAERAAAAALINADDV